LNPIFSNIAKAMALSAAGAIVFEGSMVFDAHRCPADSRCATSPAPIFHALGEAPEKVSVSVIAPSLTFVSIDREA
jgi:hypothetical protein